jgi:dolichyl-phosphate beta-glucosyltransferase
MTAGEIGHDGPWLSIVIPAYNEARRLPTTLPRLVEYLGPQPWSWEVRVVDDGSEDATASVVEGFRRADARVVLQREPHDGKGAAVKAGLLAARGAYRFICDADLSMPPHELPRFLPPVLTGVDVAIATREGHGARRIGEPVHRHLMGRVFNYLVKAIVLPGISDTQCGFKMFTARAVAEIFPEVTVNGWGFDIQVLALARRRRLRIVEVPIEWQYRDESQVSMLRDGPTMVRDLLHIRSQLRNTRD